ncbi:hypothetical protein F442_14597 [Phytophthora nicotianae P10297]|uniref:Uncharacterized protein n=1 Tax=Phytophthora nicotianae P10297 TaxID=1317064 RepID=W2YSF9_PHYNI|nr:hypothetical protein F442_14597 [Phytophthora nicotianae P10297]
MTQAELVRELESPVNLIKLINLICAKYGLDSKKHTNLTNIKAFLGPLQVDSIANQVSSIDAANALIVDLYDKKRSDPRLRASLPEDLDRTKQYLLKLIKTPGEDKEALTP